MGCTRLIWHTNNLITWIQIETTRYYSNNKPIQQLRGNFIPLYSGGEVLFNIQWFRAQTFWVFYFTSRNELAKKKMTIGNWVKKRLTWVIHTTRICPFSHMLCMDTHQMIECICFLSILEQIRVRHLKRKMTYKFQIDYWKMNNRCYG